MATTADWLDRVLIEGNRLVLCTSQAMYDEVWTRLDAKGRPDDYLGDACARCHSFLTDDTIRTSVVCIDAEKAQQKDGIQVAALLVHEAVHVWRHFRQQIGEHDPSAEFEAYSIQAIAQALMYEYARQMNDGRA